MYAGRFSHAYNWLVLICLSANHKNSSFDLLEKLSTADAAAPRILNEHPRFTGAVVVATCNRFEAYLDLDEPFGVSPLTAIHAAIRAVSATADIDPAALRDSMDLVHGNAVAEHLFAVSSGLESVVVGEGEIAGQVRRALEHARSIGTTSPELERLFQRASQTSRGVKNSTGLGTAGRSLVRLSLDLAESRVTDWANTRVLLVGTGRYAGASLAALRDRGVTDVRVYSPSNRATKFAASHSIPAVAADDFSAETAHADIIVTCTTLEQHVIDNALLRTGRRVSAVAPDAGSAAAVCPFTSEQKNRLGGATTERRQLIIDLGLPRNVAPDVVEVAGVELLDLETIRLHAPLEALNATSDARAIVRTAARAFTEVAEEQTLTPSVVALRRHVFDILDAEIERLHTRGEGSEQTEAALRHLAGVLLHVPMVRSREHARAGEHTAYIDGLEAIFGISASATATTSSASATVGASAETRAQRAAG